MKTKILLAFFALGCSQVMQADPTILSVELNNGSSYSFQLDEKSEIALNEDKLVVNEEDNTSFEIDDVKDFIFSDSDVDKDQLLNESNTLKVVTLADDLIHIEGLNCNADVDLMSLNRGLISSINANDDGVVGIVLPETNDTYVISDGQHSVKVIRK